MPLNSPSVWKQCGGKASSLWWASGINSWLPSTTEKATVRSWSITLSCAWRYSFLLPWVCKSVIFWSILGKQGTVINIVQCLSPVPSLTRGRTSPCLVQDHLHLFLFSRGVGCTCSCCLLLVKRKKNNSYYCHGDSGTFIYGGYCESNLSGTWEHVAESTLNPFWPDNNKQTRVNSLNTVVELTVLCGAWVEELLSKCAGTTCRQNMPKLF